MEYLPFGELLVDEHTNSYNSPFKYNGKELDEETGNYYYSARYYDPKWSIFISVDPLADADKNIGYSPYVYAINNPITYTDPDGRCWQKVGDSYVPCDDASVGSTTTGAFGHSWTMTKNDGWQLTNCADPSTVNYEYDAVPASGNASYYEDRYKNHIEKYNTRPPDYYLGYGHKYINRFKNETRDKLTGLGKEWLDETAVALQQMMNQGISANPSIQGNNDAFQGFAYGTHVPAYSGSGKIGLLKGNDLWHIMWTPDIKDSFLSKDGVKQIMGMFPHILKSPRNPDLWDHEKNPGLLKPWEPKW